MSELDALDPVPEQVKLTSGTVVVLENLRARQFFKLLRIITHGALPVLQDFSILRVDPDEDPGVFGTRLLSLMALSIPDAEDETIAFLRCMCKPSGLIEGRRLNKADSERNAALWATLDDELENPDLDDLITLVEAIVRREAEDLQALGKRLIGMFKLAEKTGQLDPRRQTSTPTTSNSSAASAEPSTSSPPSTAGPTPSSPTSPSDGSDSASRSSGNEATTGTGSASSG